MKRRRLKQPDFAAVLYRIATHDLKAVHREMRKEPVGKRKINGDDMFYLEFLSGYYFMEDILKNCLKEAAKMIRRARRARDSKS